MIEKKSSIFKWLQKYTKFNLSDKPKNYHAELTPHPPPSPEHSSRAAVEIYGCIFVKLYTIHFFFFNSCISIAHTFRNVSAGLEGSTNEKVWEQRNNFEKMRSIKAAITVHVSLCSVLCSGVEKQIWLCKRPVNGFCQQNPSGVYKQTCLDVIARWQRMMVRQVREQVGWGWNSKSSNFHLILQNSKFLHFGISCCYVWKQKRRSSIFRCFFATVNLLAD